MTRSARLLTGISSRPPHDVPLHDFEDASMIDSRHRNTALLVSGCFFMEMLDGTIVTTASPQIGQSLHAPATEIGLVVTAYLLTLAVLIPLSGWLTRRRGNRTVFLSAIALFTFAS